MKILDFLHPKAISADLKATDKEGVLKELVDLLVTAGVIKDSKERDRLVKTLMAREALGSTGIGLGIGIPHGKTNAVNNLFAAYGLSRKGVNFEALDGEPVHIFFLLVAPEDCAGQHLKALARISRLLKDKFFRDTLKQCKDEKETLKAISAEDQRR